MICYDRCNEKQCSHLIGGLGRATNAYSQSGQVEAVSACQRDRDIAYNTGRGCESEQVHDGSASQDTLLQQHRQLVSTMKLLVLLNAIVDLLVLV